MFAVFIIIYCGCYIALTYLTPDLLEVCDPLLMTGRTAISDDDEEPEQKTNAAHGKVFLLLSFNDFPLGRHK